MGLLFIIKSSARHGSKGSKRDATSDPNIEQLEELTGSDISVSDYAPQAFAGACPADLGKSHFQEFLVNLARRYGQGLTFMATLQVNDQHDRDYFANGFDRTPSREPTIYSQPTRCTGEFVWNLPFGRGMNWAHSGWQSAAVGGYRISGAYEAQPGVLATFGRYLRLQIRRRT